MNNKTGKLFVFEGPDGVGKTTISMAITSSLKKLYKCEYFSFPGTEPGTIGAFVYNIHHDNKKFGVNAINCNSLQALHIAAHIDLIKSKLIPLLRSGTNIILDRFWWSCIIYGKEMGCDRRIIENLVLAEKTAWDGILPDIIFNISRDFSQSNGYEKSSALLQPYENLAQLERDSSNIVKIVNIDLETSIKKIYKIIMENISLRKKFSTEQTSLFCKKNDSKTTAPSSLERLLAPTIVYDTYWKFAAERQEVFFARAKADPRPWTNDSILNDHKFTNAYRASDRVSQFLIQKVIYHGNQNAEEVFFRIMLFKFFNKIETWQLLERELGEILYSSFSIDRYDSILTNAINTHKRIYSAAYIMPTGGRNSTFERKHRMHLHLVEMMMKDKLPNKVTSARSMGKVFELLKSYPSLGDFLAYQYATDINYSELTDFPETQFVIPGPGAKDGIKKCFTKTGGLSEAEIIKIVMERQEEEFLRLGLEFKTLWGRPLMLIDCQNIFCETDKYARVKHPDIKGLTGRSRIKQKFHPNPQKIDLWYPPKWGINDKIRNGEMP